MFEKSDNEIIQIIQKYINIIREILEREKLEEEAIKLEYITKTEIVPHDFFSDKNGKVSSCDKENIILFKDFGTPIVLFNDLKNSTKLVEELECKNELCIYAIYMYYSSKMLGDILDVLNGKMVECTGDGNYSIFLEDEIQKSIIPQSIYFFHSLKDIYDSANFIKIKDYILNFDTDEVKYIYPWICDYQPHQIFKRQYFIRVLSNQNKISNIIRVLFFHIYAIFNIEVNTILENRIKQKFLTRIGCKQGLCKISRIDINGHIKQDKLIGSVVHQAAHQASGK
ncbi:hypothetical protein [Nitratifractor salsuginis]|uniref:Uncharacterized protein n=1 Tax=Nitratifractor salsuginis (strain DSM 16511 / JCM 12458 / E9I37-1) TaxID=749222 RepID=E6X1E1_NITSE|nr:hypothetical protein [Nitratifractor salsuginis]ADV45874.1 hypothetical protein Nitsa_0606 [Nitratifractor salsuginis DSM 16511]